MCAAVRSVLVTLVLVGGRKTLDRHKAVQIMKCAHRNTMTLIHTACSSVLYSVRTSLHV